MTKIMPKMVTFTGVDMRTSWFDMYEISREYNGHVEWGALYGSNEAKRRYLNFDTLHNLIRWANDHSMQISVHLCGRWSKQVLFHGRLDGIPETIPNRYQVNYAGQYRIEGLRWLHNRTSRPVIAQVRGEFVDKFNTNGIKQLFDRSGGRGERPDKLWPWQPDDHLFVGYAGGINHRNVLETIDQIHATNYWIDMETGVRTDDWFDLSKCRKVLEAIYG